MSENAPFRTRNRTKAINNHKLTISVGGKGEFGVPWTLNREVTWSDLKQSLLSRPANDAFFDRNLRPEASAPPWPDRDLGDHWFPGKAQIDGNGRRAIASVSCLVFDLLHASREQINFIREGRWDANLVAWFLHALPSDTVTQPHARLIIPLFAPVSPRKAHAISHVLVDEFVDDEDEAERLVNQGTFQIGRPIPRVQMDEIENFWAACSDGAPIFPDTFLDCHPEWRRIVFPPCLERKSKGDAFLCAE